MHPNTCEIIIDMHKGGSLDNIKRDRIIDRQFQNVCRKFCDDINTFHTKYGDKYGKAFPNDRLYKVFKIKNNILCHYIVDICKLMHSSGKLTIPRCHDESDISKWFKESCTHLGIVPLERHQGGLDYWCRYRPDDDMYTRLFSGILYTKYIYNSVLTIELEYLSSNFKLHKHPIDLVDMIICYRKDKDVYYNIFDDKKVPILELSSIINDKGDSYV